MVHLEASLFTLTQHLFGEPSGRLAPSYQCLSLLRWGTDLLLAPIGTP